MAKLIGPAYKGKAYTKRLTVTVITVFEPSRSFEDNLNNPKVLGWEVRQSDGYDDSKQLFRGTEAECLAFAEAF